MRSGVRRLGLHRRGFRTSLRDVSRVLAVLLALVGAIVWVPTPTAGLTIAPGVVFAPSASWTDISFTTSQQVSPVQVDPTGVLFGSVRLGVTKLPASQPRATVIISVWNPLQTTLNGTVLDFSGNAPTGSTLTFSLSNLIPAREYLLQADGVSQGSHFSNESGFVSFGWSNFTSHDLSVLLGWRTGLPAPPPPLSADFSFAPPSPGIGQAVGFAGVAGGGVPPYNYTWSFGDGAVGFGPNLSHAYAAAGNETVSLAVLDVSGTSANATKLIVVQGVPPPPSFYASFAFAPATPYTDTRVTFGSVVSGGATPYNYTWAFGDGSSGFAASVVHAYQRAGTFHVNLTVRDASGARAQASSTVIVKPFPASVPGSVTAAFAFAVDGAIVSFVDRSSSDVSLPIIERFWAFGDGTSSRDLNPVHTYPLPGLFATYTVVLAICDSGSHCAAASRSVFLLNWALLTAILLLVGGTALAVSAFLVRRRRIRKGQERQPEDLNPSEAPHRRPLRPLPVRRLRRQRKVLRIQGTRPVR
jgi:PKD repeat protein